MGGRRRELGEFVRGWRERRAPAEVGLPVVGYRRTAGLRREEVAVLAGVSVTWYTWLEQGRDIRVSPQVLGSLAGVLGLDAVERRHLFRLAGEVPPPEVEEDAGGEVARAYRLLLERVEPDAAFLMNRRLDIVAWNRGCADVYGDLGALLPEQRNVLWLAFLSPRLRGLSPDWEADAAQTVALFRAQIGEHVQETAVAEMVARLEKESDDFARVWRRRDLAPFVPGPRLLRLGGGEAVAVEQVKMRGVGDGLTFVAMLRDPDPSGSNGRG